MWLQMFMALEAMSDGAVMAGVPRALSYELAAQTMAVSALLSVGDRASYRGRD